MRKPKHIFYFICLLIFAVIVSMLVFPHIYRALLYKPEKEPIEPPAKIDPIGTQQTVVGELDFALDSEGKYYTVLGLGTYVGTDVTIPDYYGGLPVKVIAEDAFKNFSQMTSVYIGENVETIGARAFFGCSSLTSVKLPLGVTEILDYTFANCTSLTKVGTSENTTRVGMAAFKDCVKLCHIEFTEDIKYIGTDAFSGCAALGVVDDEDANRIKYLGYTKRDNFIATVILEVGKKDIGIYDIPHTVRVIYDEAFAECDLLTEIDLSAVVSIGNYAFSECSKLNNTCLTVDSPLEFIGERAFHECDALQGFIIPASVSEIGERAFYGCQRIKSVTLSANLAKEEAVIGEKIFIGCKGITKVYFDGTSDMWEIISSKNLSLPETFTLEYQNND